MSTPARRPAPHYLTVEEVAKAMRVSKMTVYRLIRREDLRAYRIGRSLRVDSRDVTVFLRSANTIEWELNGGGAA